MTKEKVLTKMLIYWWAWPQPLSGLESRILWIVPGPIACLLQLISSLEDFSIIGKEHDNWTLQASALERSGVHDPLDSARARKLPPPINKQPGGLQHNR